MINLKEQANSAPWWVWLIAALLLVGGGMALSWKLYGPKPAVQETASAAVVQSDGSQILERKPDPQATATMETPTGSTLERLVKLKVRAKPVMTASGTVAKPLPDGVSCPPVNVDLALVRMPDQTRRVIASSPDGEILGGLDIPVENAAVSEQPKWAAGLSYDTGRKAGLWMDRDLGPFRAGVAVRQGDSGGIRGEIRAGVRF